MAWIPIFVQRIFLLWWWQPCGNGNAKFNKLHLVQKLDWWWKKGTFRTFSNYPYDWLFLEMILVKSSIQKFFSCWLGWPNPHIQPTKDGQEKVSSIDRFAPGKCCSEKLCGENYFLSSVWLVQVRIRCWLDPPMLVYVLRCLICLGKNRVTHHLPSHFAFDSDCFKK